MAGERESKDFQYVYSLESYFKRLGSSSESRLSDHCGKSYSIPFKPDQSLNLTSFNLETHETKEDQESFKKRRKMVSTILRKDIEVNNTTVFTLQGVTPEQSEEITKSLGCDWEAIKAGNLLTLYDKTKLKKTNEAVSEFKNEYTQTLTAVFTAVSQSEDKTSQPQIKVVNIDYAPQKLVEDQKKEVTQPVFISRLEEWLNQHTPESKQEPKTTTILVGDFKRNLPEPSIFPLDNYTKTVKTERDNSYLLPGSDACFLKLPDRPIEQIATQKLIARELDIEKRAHLIRKPLTTNRPQEEFPYTPVAFPNNRKLFRMGPTFGECYNQNDCRLEVDPRSGCSTVLRIYENGNQENVFYSHSQLDKILLLRNFLQSDKKQTDKKQTTSPLITLFNQIENHTFSDDAQKNKNIKTKIERAALDLLSAHDEVLLTSSKIEKDEALKVFNKATLKYQKLIYNIKASGWTKACDALLTFGAMLIKSIGWIILGLAIGTLFGFMLGGGGANQPTTTLAPLLDIIVTRDQFALILGAFFGGGFALLSSVFIAAPKAYVHSQAKHYQDFLKNDVAGSYKFFQAVTSEKLEKIMPLNTMNLN